LGQITPEQAARHSFRHTLTRSLGGGTRPADADFQRAALANGDQFLLCTDGLTHMVAPAAVAAVLAGAATAVDACQRLIDADLEHAGKDNVTVALARYRSRLERKGTWPGQNVCLNEPRPLLLSESCRQ
jgi:serine/threonine protein phosphatase PrpC